MEKWFVKIIYTAFLLSVGISFIGVNVSWVYCGHCEKTYVQVQIIPQERGCECEGPCYCKEGKECQGGIPDTHVFYKVNDYPAAEQGIKLNVLLGCLLKEKVCSVVINRTYKTEYKPVVSVVAEWPPEQEELCIYLC